MIWISLKWLSRLSSLRNHFKDYPSMMIRELIKVLVILIMTFNSTCQAQESISFGKQLINKFKSTQVSLNKAFTEEKIKVEIVNNTNSEAYLFFLEKENEKSFVAHSIDTNMIFSLDVKDYWVLIFYENLSLDSFADVTGNSQNHLGLEVLSFNILTENEQTITLTNSFFSKIIGIGEVKDTYGNHLSNNQFSQYSHLSITFEDELNFELEFENNMKHLILGRTESEIEFAFKELLIFPNNPNELAAFTLSYQSRGENIDNFYIDADLSKMESLVIDFHLPFASELTESYLSLEAANHIYILPPLYTSVKYYGTNNDNIKNYHAVNMQINDGENFIRIAQSPTFIFGSDGKVFLTKNTGIEGSSEFIKYYLEKNRISVNANSTFWGQSVSYLLDQGQIYVLGFGKPYSSVGNYSDSIGSSYKLGLNGSYEVKCQDKIITSGNENIISDSSFETYYGDEFISIKVPKNTCSQLTLEFQYDSYLNNNKYTSTSSYEFDQGRSQQANGGIMVTDIVLYENDKLVTNSIISKINPRIAIGTQYTLFPKLEVLGQLDEGEWIRLPEIVRTDKNSSVTFVLPHSKAKKVLNLKIIAGDDFEKIEHTLNGFAYIGIELDSENDADSDGILDSEDIDDDNDGIQDSLDNAPYDVWDWKPNNNENNELAHPTKPPSNQNGGNILILSLILSVILAIRKPVL